MDSSIHLTVSWGYTSYKSTHNELAYENSSNIRVLALDLERSLDRELTEGDADEPACERQRPGTDLRLAPTLLNLHSWRSPE